MKHYKITAKGKVQGVGYRNFTKLQADKRHYIGTVQNLENGNVEIYIGLPDYSHLGEFLELLWAGNGRMQTNTFEVEIVKESNFEHKDSKDFQVIS
ncbi:hypothetical protein LS73_004155 [Helicobacter muridarum]|uniref:acylphosphatase n=1 Tax=Helicobacter muridarum TaxID=216 RepID=A0A099TXF4_9HELI|nr:acylphosphatase [Helicobacter muridarum]TLE00608.1 hypothetical protein LS73_004155 [Helicobacter muridarum]STQ85625.1 acylphosphatase [Helicobacter muridarum]